MRRYDTSKKIVSMDIKSNIASYNHTYITELVPVCKDDLICNPAHSSSPALRHLPSNAHSTLIQPHLLTKRRKLRSKAPTRGPFWNRVLESAQCAHNGDASGERRYYSFATN